MKQKRYYEASLLHNSKELNAYKEEHAIVESLEQNDVISKEDANS